MSGGWWLDPIPDGLRDGAVAAIEAGDIIGFLITAGNEWSLHLVFYNMGRLKRLGFYERALLDAFTATRANNSRMMGCLRLMFEAADRDRLRRAGDALPGNGPFTLYRGVAGNGRARHVRGLSWTSSLPVAKWFASRYAVGFPSPVACLENPAVYRVVVHVNDVLAYSNRGEQEFIVLLPESKRPKLLLNAAFLRANADEITAWMDERRREEREISEKRGEQFRREHAKEIAAMRQREAQRAGIVTA